MKITEKIDLRFPKTLAEALRLQADDKTRGKLLAGGTDLMVQWAAGVPIPERAVSVWNLPELSAIEIFPDRIEVGAGVTHAFLRDAAQRHTHEPPLPTAAEGCCRISKGINTNAKNSRARSFTSATLAHTGP